MSKVISGISADLKRIQENIREQLKEADTKKMLLMNMPYILTGYFANLVSRIYRLAAGNDFSEKAMFLMQDLENILANPFPSLHPTDLGIGVACGIALKLVVLQKAKNAKKFRPGVEYGSARWGTAKDIAPYMDKEFEKNIPLTQTESLMMSGRPKEPKYARNKNILVIGGSGSGKTRFFVKPSLMQLHSSYVVTDPKGTLVLECGKMLVNAGYKVKVLNTINFNKSMRYNPFAYIRSEKDILKLVNTIMVNTKGEGAQATEDFWSKAERLLFTAYIGYIWYESVENKPLAKVEELEEGNYNKIDGLIDTSEKHNKKENEAKHVRISIRDKMAEKKEEMEKRKKQKECEAVKGKTIGSSHIVGSFSKNDMLQ